MDIDQSHEDGSGPPQGDDYSAAAAAAAAAAEDATEASPLLGQRGGGGGRGVARARRPPHRPTLSLASITSVAHNVNVPKVHSSSTIVNLLCVILFVGTSAAGFWLIPLTRLIEDTLCHEFYDRAGEALPLTQPIDEEDCKGNWVQTNMAFVMAILEMVTAVVSFVGAFPWGLVADRIGRRPVVTLALGGIILCTMWQMLVIYRRDVLPLELLWLGPAGLLVGGGNAIVVGIVLSMMTDATREEERALAFMRAHVASLCGNLISPGLASIMMSRQGPWPCMWLAVALLATAGISFLFVPETVPPRSPERPVEAAVEQPSTFGAKLSHTVSRYRESLSMLKSPSLILLLVTLLLTTPVSVATLQFMTQFVSKRYGIKIYQTGYVQSAYGVVQVLCALVFLPWVSKLLIKGSVPARFRASNEHSRDLTLMRWSHGILIVGALVLGLSPTLAGFVFGLVLMAIGAGYNSLNRSMMSLYVDPEHRSRLFSLVGMVDVVGAVYSQPMLAALFAVGLRLEGGWIGLPYYVLSAQVAVVLGLLMLVRLPDSKAAQDVPEDEGRD